MKLLHVDSSILGANSVSRSLSAAAVVHIVGEDERVGVTYRDLAADPLPHLSGEALAFASGAAAPASGEVDQSIAHELAIGEQVLEEFLAADVIVIGVAFYNFTIPTQLKAWIDRIAVAGRTFRYTESGPEGLAGGKRLILTIARGGLYAEGNPAAPFEHAESYLRGVFAFMGITEPEVIVAEGLNLGPESRQQAVDAAFHRISQLP